MTQVKSPPSGGLNCFREDLTASARAPTAHAPVARSVTRHDRAADVAAWSVAHVHQISHGIGGVVDAAIFEMWRAGIVAFGRWRLAMNQTALRRGCFCVALAGQKRLLRFHRGRQLGRTGFARRRRNDHVLEQRELLSGDEADFQPAEDVVHHRLGNRDLLVAGEAAGLEAGVLEFVAQQAQRNSVLQRERDRRGEGIHETGNGGAFLGHADKEFAGYAVLIEAHGDVALMAGDGELVGERGALLRQAVAQRARRGRLLVFAADACQPAYRVKDSALDFAGRSVGQAHHLQSKGLLLGGEYGPGLVGG